MTDLLQKFEDDCVGAGVKPQDALKEGGLHATNWWRWKAGKVSPSLKNFEMAQNGLVRLKSRPKTRQTA